VEKAFHEADLLTRVAGDTLVVTPPLIVSEAQIEEIAEKVGRVIRLVE
jgi:beta-alanine--pyruvate transaminase